MLKPDISTLLLQISKAAFDFYSFDQVKLEFQQFIAEVLEEASQLIAQFFVAEDEINIKKSEVAKQKMTLLQSQAKLAEIEKNLLAVRSSDTERVCKIVGNFDPKKRVLFEELQLKQNSIGSHQELIIVKNNRIARIKNEKLNLEKELSAIDTGTEVEFLTLYPNPDQSYKPIFADRTRYWFRYTCPPFTRAQENGVAGTNYRRKNYRPSEGVYIAKLKSYSQPHVKLYCEKRNTPENKDKIPKLRQQIEQKNSELLKQKSGLDELENLQIELIRAFKLIKLDLIAAIEKEKKELLQQNEVVKTETLAAEQYINEAEIQQRQTRETFKNQQDFFNIILQLSEFIDFNFPEQPMLVSDFFTQYQKLLENFSEDLVALAVTKNANSFFWLNNPVSLNNVRPLYSQLQLTT